MRATTVGVVLQGAGRNLLPYLTAEQNVRFAQRGVPGAAAALPDPVRCSPSSALAGPGDAAPGRS